MESAFTPTLGAWLILASLVLLLHAIFLTVYRLAFHPLAAFPGPKIAAATKWYECFYDTVCGEGGQYAWRIREMHERYGPIVRINPSEIHVQDPQYYDTIYAPLPARRDKYGPAASMAGSPLGTFGTVEHQIHRKRRAANSPLFSSKSVAASQPIIDEHATILCNSISNAFRKQEILHVQTYILAFTTDLLTLWILGTPLGCQHDHAMAEAWERTTRALPRITPWGKQFPWLIGAALKLPVCLVRFMFPTLATIIAFHRDMHDRAQGHAQKRDEATDSRSRQDLYSTNKRVTVFEAIDLSLLPPDEKSIRRVAQEAFVLISAGTETSARAITACLYQLVSHPEAFTRLREALVTVMPEPNSRPVLRALEEIPYFTAVLKETLRTMQLVTSRLPLVAPDDLIYKQWTIPAGTPVSMTINEVLTDGSIYPDPNTFKPGRWLDDGGQLHDKNQRLFPAFGRGTRACQGQNVAWAELYICVARLVRRFDFELFDTVRSRDFDVTRDCFFGTTTENSRGIRMRVTKDYLA